MQKNYDAIVISLAGILQAITLLLDISQTGKIDESAFETCIYSLFQTHPKNFIDVFGNLHRLKLGLEKLTALLMHSPRINELHKLQSRYLLSLIHLQKKVTRSSQLLDMLKERLIKIEAQVNYFSMLHPTVISNLADLYTDLIRPLNFKMRLLGDPRVLMAKENMEKAKCLLLAGIRGTTLWRQSGGSRFQLLLMRHKLLDTTKRLLLIAQSSEP